MTTDTDRLGGDVAAGPLDIRSLRHPTEPQRFALAIVSVVSAMAVVIALLAVIGWAQVVVVGLGLGLLLGSLWIGLQLFRVRILGDAVRVGPETLPALQEAIDEVRQRLDYHKRVDVFVVPKLSPPVQLTSYFGVRVLLVEGGAVADLTSTENRPQLLFLLGTYFGGLKAKHTRWTPAAVILGELGLQRILAPLLCPWLRATVYTGDQIAYACTRDLGVSLDATYRILVGRELSRQLQADGLITQAAGVRKSTILRLSQLIRPMPHATNRFLNLLHFAHSVDPDSVTRFRSTLAPVASTTLDTAFPQIARANKRRTGVFLTACLTVAVAAFVTYAVMDNRAALAGSGIEPGAGTVIPLDPAAPPEPEPVPTPEPEPEPEPVPEPIEPTAGDVLLAVVGPSMDESCTEFLPEEERTGGLVAAVQCQPGTASEPEWVEVYAYDGPASLAVAVEFLLGGIGEGRCLDGGHGTWSLDGLERGTLGCYDTEDQSVVVWSYDDETILAVAADSIAGIGWLYEWWQGTTLVSALGQ